MLGGHFPKVKQSRTRFSEERRYKVRECKQDVPRGIENMPDRELLKLNMVQIYVLPASEKRIEMKHKRKTKKPS